MNFESQASRSFTCEVRTLDDLCAEQGIGRIDLLKIEVEGFEVLADGGKMLLVAGALVVEVSLIRRTGDADVLGRMLKQVRKAGFQLVELLSSYRDPARPWLPLEFNLIARRG